MWIALVVKVSRVSLPRPLFHHQTDLWTPHLVASASGWHAVWKLQPLFLCLSAASL